MRTVARVQRLVLTRSEALALSQGNVYTPFVSDLVLAKSVAVGKTPRQALLFDCLLYWSHIAWACCHHYETGSTLRLTESTIPVRDVVMVPGLLSIFLHGCEIKSGSGLGTRLQLHDLVTYYSIRASLGSWIIMYTSLFRKSCLSSQLAR